LFELYEPTTTTAGKSLNCFEQLHRFMIISNRLNYVLPDFFIISNLILDSGSPDNTRRVIQDLLTVESSQELLDLICAIVVELSVVILHPKSLHQKSIVQAEKNEKLLSPNTSKNNSNNSIAIARSTRLGTVSLPKVFDDFPLPSLNATANRKLNQSVELSCDNNIPIQSSESSNDDMVSIF